eukprot:386723-Pelagomonas_calceolata.AAC.7
MQWCAVETKSAYIHTRWDEYIGRSSKHAYKGVQWRQTVHTYIRTRWDKLRGGLPTHAYLWCALETRRLCPGLVGLDHGCQCMRALVE